MTEGEATAMWRLRYERTLAIAAVAMQDQDWAIKSRARMRDVVEAARLVDALGCECNDNRCAGPDTGSEACRRTGQKE